MKALYAFPLEEILRSPHTAPAEDFSHERLLVPFWNANEQLCCGSKLNHFWAQNSSLGQNEDCPNNVSEPNDQTNTCSCLIQS